MYLFVCGTGDVDDVQQHVCLSQVVQKFVAQSLESQ